MAKRDKKTPPPVPPVVPFTPPADVVPDAPAAPKVVGEETLGARVRRVGEKGKKFVGGMSRGQKALGLLTLGTMALPYAGQMWNGLKSDWNVGSRFGDGVTGEEEALQWQKQVQAVELARQRREEKIQKLAAINAARIQQYAPHLAAKLLTGRDLPRQGILIGGEGGRQDVLQQAARDMAEGKYGGMGEREYAARQDLSAQQANMMALPPGG